MPPESAKYLRDMLDAARAIEQHSHNRTKEEFLQNRLLRDAVNWNFCVVGEALSQLKRIDQPLVERITDHWKIIGLRNQLVHGYGVINNQITWDIVQSKLPILIQELERLLAS
jgi:uncharacterized protein with HEPN domain